NPTSSVRFANSRGLPHGTRPSTRSLGDTPQGNKAPEKGILMTLRSGDGERSGQLAAQPDEQRLTREPGRQVELLARAPRLPRAPSSSGAAAAAGSNPGSV